MEFTCQSYYFLLSFFLLSGAQQREHKELAPVTVKEIEENMKVMRHEGEERKETRLTACL
tara:strand:+ start:1127 stop:1306 length:180 start_codon:yes stop_codon:yes gene_type:complete